MRPFTGRGTARTQTETGKQNPSSTIATAVALSIFCLSPPAFAQGAPISHGYLTGVWQDNAQCAGGTTMVFYPNNTMSSAGSIPVNYTVTGPSQFTMYGPGGAVAVQAQYVNQNQMVITFQNDASVLYRCGAPGGAAAGTNTQLSASYITGGWGLNGNCSAPERFAASGHFQTSNNDPGTWALFGNTLRMTVNNGNSLDFFVQVNGPRNMTLTQSNNGQVSNYTRCF